MAETSEVEAVMRVLRCDTTPRQTRAMQVDGITIGGGIERGCRTHKDRYGIPLAAADDTCPVAREVVAALDLDARDAEINDRWRALVGGVAIGARANGNFDRERAALDILAIDERTP